MPRPISTLLFHPPDRLRIAAVLLGLACLAPLSRAQVVNLWPVFVGEGKDGTAPAFGQDFSSWNAAGPLVFHETVSGIDARGFRPLFVRFQDPVSGHVRGHFLYPVFNYRIEDDYSNWNIFYLLNFKSEQEPGVSEFNLFPFIFYKKTPDPETSYFGVFPIAGEMKRKFAQGRFSWMLFPLYGKFEKGPVTTVTTPWPFIKTVYGDDNHGFELWPIAGSRYKEGDYREKFILWPFVITRDEKLWLDQPEETRIYFPYFRQTTARYDNKSYIWPFIGHTYSTFPQYVDKRYFWPFLVQTRGKNIYVNRWGPFYTHSIRKGVDKTWVAWPIYRHQAWNESRLDQTKTQILYILFWNMTQRRPGNVDGPVARRTHLWPLASRWDNGAGTRQFQLFSPLEALFPYNQAVRSLYSPLFAVYRSEQIGDDFSRQNLLFNFITYRREADTVQTDVGPLVGWGHHENGSHFSLLKGLFGYERQENHRRFRLFWIPIGNSPPASSNP